MCMGIACEYRWLQKPDEGGGSPWAGVTGAED